MLEAHERQLVKQLLVKRLQIPELRDLVNAAGQNFDGIVGYNNQTTTESTQLLVDDAVNRGWVPRLLDQLAQKLESFQTSSTQSEANVVRAIQAAVSERLGHGTALHDPFETRFVRGRLPYVNRPDVRELFQELNQPAGKVTAIISGAPRSGKSYTSQLPLYVAALPNSKLTVYYKDISEGRYNITAYELVQEILRRWKIREPVPEQYSQDSSYAVELGEWFADMAPEDRACWIILDGVDKIVPHPSLLPFLEGLAKTIDNDPNTPIRLVLLDFGQKHLLTKDDLYLVDEVALQPLSASDLVEHFFKEIHKARGAATPFDAAVAEVKAQALLERIKDSQSQKGAVVERLEHCLLTLTRELGLVE